jgi:hypothetical protein
MFVKRSFLTPRHAVWVWLPGLLLILFGCFKTPTGTVSGTVKYKGKEVTTGKVNLHNAAKGTAAQANLDGSGGFKVEGELEVGTYKVYLSPPPPEQLAPDKMKDVKAPAFDIPPKYQDLAQTPETVEVKAGENKFAIDFK